MGAAVAVLSHIVSPWQLLHRVQVQELLVYSWMHQTFALLLTIRQKGRNALRIVILCSHLIATSFMLFLCSLQYCYVDVGCGMWDVG